MAVNIVDRALAAMLALTVLPASGDAGGPPLASLYGAYEVIGRAPGDGGEMYRGWMRLAVESQRIELDRCIAGRQSTGSGRAVTLTADQVPAVEFRYEQQGQSFVATCQVASDFDNLPRFSCYTTPADMPAIEVPGIETYFAIVWPVPLGYFDCH